MVEKYPLNKNNMKTFEVTTTENNFPIIEKFTNELNFFYDWMKKNGIDLSNYNFEYSIAETRKHSTLKVRAKEIKLKFNYKFKKL